jgi:hypothetical protein
MLSLNDRIEGLDEALSPRGEGHDPERDVVYESRGPDSLRWFWSLTVNGPMTRADRVATLEEAKAQFQKSWDAWKAWGEAGRGALKSGDTEHGEYARHRGASTL